MNLLKITAKGFRRTFCGSNAHIKHLSLFLLTGIISAASLYIQIISEIYKNPQNIPNLNIFTSALIVLFVFGIYLIGYTFIYMHNSFDEQQEEIMPAFNDKPFRIFFNSFPLILTWGFYIIAACAAAGFMAVGTDFKILGILFLIAILLVSPFVQFVFTAYCKNFDKKGLYDITLPFKFLPSTIGPLVILGLLFIVIYFASLIPSFLAGLILALSGVKNQNIIMYTGALIGGYLGTIVQLVWYYCLVQLYKKFFENFNN